MNPIKGIFVAICFLSSMLSLVSIWSYVKYLPDNLCDMTYMFQYPDYIEIPLSEKVSNEFPKYRLFVYGEGFYANQLRQGNFDGLPVLFIPGNAGSYRQVRSLASVSMVKTDRTPNSPKFNYFSIDFDERLSGLYGGYLTPQTKFASICIKKIFQLYPKNVRSSLQIILIGHSMGGLIARGVVSFNYTKANLVSIIYTLATSNLKPVISLDPFMTNYYADLDSALSSEEKNGTNEIYYVSIGGGMRDILVRSDLTTIDKPEHRVINSISSSLTHVWTSTDHLCAVWCNQLVRSIVRSMFDLYEKRLNIENDTSRKRLVLDYHFARHLGPTSAVDYLNGNSINLPLNELNSSLIEEKIELNQVMYVRFSSKSKGNYVKICPNEETMAKYLFVRTNQDVYCVLYSCPTMDDKCDQITCLPIHHVLPHSSKYVHFKLTPSHSCLYLTTWKLRSSSDYFITTLYDDEVNRRNDDVHVGNPFWWTYARKFDGNLAFFNLSLVGFSIVGQAFAVKLIPTVCREGFSKNSIMSTVQFHCPWNTAQNLYHSFRFPYNRSDDFVVQYQYSNEKRSENAKLLLFFDPKCDYELKLTSSPLVSFSQIIRFYFEFIPLICLFILISTITIKVFHLGVIFYAIFAFVTYFLAIFKRTDSTFCDLMLFAICIGIMTILQCSCSILMYILKRVGNKILRFRRVA